MYERPIVIYNNQGGNAYVLMGGNPKVNGVLLKIPSLFITQNQAKKIVAGINKSKSKSTKASIHCS